MRRILFLGILLPLAAACGGGPGSGGGLDCSVPSTEVVRLKVFPEEVRLAPGENFQLASQAFNACSFQVTGGQVTWQSGNPAAVTVSATGLASAQAGGGTARVTATLVARGGEGGARAAASATTAWADISVSGTPNPPRPSNFEIVVLPPDPVVAIGNTLQMTAQALDSQGNRIPGVQFVWTSTIPDVASINPNTGLVQAQTFGVTTITAYATQAASNPAGSVTLVVLAADGAPMPPPVINVSPSALVLAVGESREAHATVSDALTGTVLVTPVTWRLSVAGVVSVTPLSVEGDVARVTGAALGRTELTAEATVDGVTVQSQPIGIDVLADASGGAAGPWTAVQALPYTNGVYAHAMAAVGGHLVATGGVAGDLGAAGFREDVSRARMNADGTLARRDGNSGWDRSPVSSDPDPAVAVLASCTGDPPCLSIRREAFPPGVQPPDIPERTVRYQVAFHGQAATDTHVYVAGGIDAQVDLGIVPSDPGAVGPDVTRYSDRVLIGAVAADGTLTWRESNRLPAPGLAGVQDVPGRTAAPVVRYQSWLYVLGGWSWVYDNAALRYVGRNRDEILRARIDSVTGDLSSWQVAGYLPEPLNKHAATVVGDTLVVSGGAEGADENSPEVVTDRVYVAQLDPFSGDIVDGVWRESAPLPQPLEYHAMVSVPGDPRVVVIGGDNPATQSASADAYLATLNPTTGLLGDWTFLPPLPETYGLTGLAATAVGGAGSPYRIYVSGGGVPVSADVTNLDRRRGVYFIDLVPL